MWKPQRRNSFSKSYITQTRYHVPQLEQPSSIHKEKKTLCTSWQRFLTSPSYVSELYSILSETFKAKGSSQSPLYRMGSHQWEMSTCEMQSSRPPSPWEYRYWKTNRNNYLKMLNLSMRRNEFEELSESDLFDEDKRCCGINSFELGYPWMAIGYLL